MKTSYMVKHFIGSFFFFSILFISAGRVNYWQGWVYVITGLIMGVLSYTVLKPDADLLNERSNPGEGVKKWDKTILLCSGLLTIILYVVAGLDSGRYHWSPAFHWSLILSGWILTATGQLLFLWAQKQNKFFSSTVRIQTERNHTVCDTGLYKYIRHPAYLGSVIQLIGFFLLFGSLWSILPAVFLIILHLIRTYLEDKTLREDLNGYREYSLKTKYRIIPYLW